MDKTYAETKCAPPFDWNKWLSAAIEAPPTQEDYEAKCAMAAEWVSCACGNQCAIIPRNHIGAPIDMPLANLGIRFSVRISEGDYESAQRALHEIEERSAMLIERELAKLNEAPTS